MQRAVKQTQTHKTPFLLRGKGLWSQTNPKSMPGTNYEGEAYD